MREGSAICGDGVILGSWGRFVPVCSGDLVQRRLWWVFLKNIGDVVGRILH